MTASSTLTTREVADRLGIEPVTVRRWVQKGWLRPVQRGRPLRFRELDVERAKTRAMTAAEHARLDEAATRWVGAFDSR